MTVKYPWVAGKVFLFLLLAGVFFPTGNEFAGNCPGVICFLKKDASAKLRASRSSDGPGEVSDILNHKKSTISGTAERENSWWSIDLGLSHRLIITHYSFETRQKAWRISTYRLATRGIS